MFKFNRLPNTQNKNGFALIISLMVMSLIMILILALSSMVRVETKLAESRINTSKARTNALLSMNMAIAQLQEMTGVDTRITAPSQSTNSAVSKWVGVWDSEKPLSAVNNPLDSSSQYYNYSNRNNTYFKQWLVSGNKEKYNDQSVGSSVSIEGTEVEKVLIDDNNGEENYYAYFIEDESLKANVAFTEPSDGIEGILYPNDPGLEILDGLDQFNKIVPDLKKVIHLNQMDYLMKKINAENAWVDYKDKFTVHSLGLFTDSKMGGLRKDLESYFQMKDSAGYPASLPGYRKSSDSSSVRRIIDLPDFTPNRYGDGSDSSDAPTWKYFKSFYKIDRGSPVVPQVQTRDTYGIGPVFRQAIINFYPKLHGTKFRLYIDMQIVLWNPYNVELSPKEYELVFSLPTTPRSFSLIPQFKDPVAPNPVYTMGDLINHPDILLNQNNVSTGRSGHSLRFRIRPTTFLPGDFRVFAISDDDDDTPFTGVNYMDNDDLSPNSVYLESVDDLPAGAAGYGFRLVTDYGKSPESGDNFHSKNFAVPNLWIKEVGTPYDNTSGAYQVINAGGLNNYDGNNFSADPLSSTLAPNIQTGLVRSMELVSNNFQGSPFRMNWISLFNATARSQDRAIPLYQDYTISRGDYKEEQSGISDAGSGYTFDGLSRSTTYFGQPSLTRFVLYDLPDSTYKVPSLAFLQHCSFDITQNSPSHVIGNSRAEFRLYEKDTVYHSKHSVTSAMNTCWSTPVIDYSYLLNDALWDSYFLSSVQKNNLNYELKNSCFKLLGENYEELGNKVNAMNSPFDEMASNIVNKNALNVNSLSVEAWKSLLAMGNENRFDPQNGSVGSALKSPFFRAFKTLEDSSEDLHSAVKGFRELSDIQIENIAQEIVKQIKGRGPFLSISDFVNRRLEDSIYGNSGAIHQAIHEAGINDLIATYGGTAVHNTVKASGSDDTIFNDIKDDASMMEGASGWLSQADVLQKIGNSLTARGDTFKIHAYGETITLSGEKVTAECEVVVQRIPEYVDDSNTPEVSPRVFNHTSEKYENNPIFSDINKKFGRKYQIISFQWK